MELGTNGGSARCRRGYRPRGQGSIAGVPRLDNQDATGRLAVSEAKLPTPHRHRNVDTLIGARIQRPLVVVPRTLEVLLGGDSSRSSSTGARSQAADDLGLKSSAAAFHSA